MSSFAQTAVGALLPFAILLAVYLIPSVRGAVSKRLERWATHHFDEKLEKYRHDLLLEAEQIKARFQSDLINRGIVTQRQHEVARELHKTIHEAQGKVSGLFGFRREPDYRRFRLEEVKELLQEEKIGQELQESVLGIWESHRERAIENLVGCLELVRLNRATEAYIDAWNYYLSNSLYLPDSITDHVRQVFDKLRTILEVARLPVEHRDSSSDVRSTASEASELTWALRRKLQAFLGMRVESVDVDKGGG